MAKDYVKTDTMRIKISGGNSQQDFTGLDLINQETPSSSHQSQKTYERDFNELLESVYDAVIITDVNGNVTKFNGRALEYFDYPMQTFYRLNVLNIISGADEHTLKTIYQTLVSERRIFIEGFCIRRDNSVFPAEIAVSILHIYDHEQLCFFIRNISVRIQTEEALREAQQELIETAHHAGMAEIATGVLHDVGNILNSINVSCELMIKSLQESTLDAMLKVNELVLRQKDFADFVANNPKGQKMPEIYRQLGDRLGKERTGILKEAENLKSKIQIIKEVISTQQTYAKTGLFEEDTRIEALIEDALAILKSTIEQDDIQVEKAFKQVPSVRVQKSKFVHIVLNIIKNARDALVNVTDRQRKIRVDIFEDGNFVSVRITDNGEGITQDDLSKIFTHGFTTKLSGHGFGLHSCANLMTEMGGKIQVNSPGKGQGATFTLTLPIVRDEENKDT